MNTRTGEFISSEQMQEMLSRVDSEVYRRQVQQRFTLVSQDEFDLVKDLPAQQRPKELKKHRYKTRRKQSR